jgi:hypothetical protein
MKYGLIFSFLFLFLACSKEEPDPTEAIRSLIMSNGWILDKYVFYFNDERDQIEIDSLSARILYSDSTDDRKSILKIRWMVFDTFARTLSVRNQYRRPKGETEWTLTGISNLLGESQSDWGFDKNDSLYININVSGEGTDFRRIEILNEDRFIIKDAIIVESIRPIPDKEGTVTIIFGDYPSGTVRRIDNVYRVAAANEGPHMIPPWPYWPW